MIRCRQLVKLVDDRKLREIGGRLFRYAKHDQRAIVVRSNPRATVAVGGRED